MKSPEEIEQALHRLVPAAMSARAQQSISGMISSLAHENVLPDSTIAYTPVKRNPWRTAAAAAVAIGAIGTMAWSWLPQTESSVALHQDLPFTSEPDTDVSPILIDRVFVSDDVALEGTLTAADGSIVHQVNRRIQTRERYRDTKKGYLITVSETRDEKIFTPKKGF
jgi:hypothetical protein